jgi:hypothetical protein
VQRASTDSRVVTLASRGVAGSAVVQVLTGYSDVSEHRPFSCLTILPPAVPVRSEPLGVLPNARAWIPVGGQPARCSRTARAADALAAE